MEASWDRVESFRKLSLQEVNSYVLTVGETAVEFTLLSEGKANTNYRVRLSGGRDVVLRLHMRDPKAAALEKAIADRLADRIPVPRVISYDPERSASIIEWKPGVTLERLVAAGRMSEVTSAAEGIGRALAEISAVTFDAAGFLSPGFSIVDPWTSSIDGLLGYLRYCLGRDVLATQLGKNQMEGVLTLFERSAARLEVASGPPCLVHGDFKASNLLIEAGQLSGVLDWEFAHSGTYLFSFAQLFRHHDSLPMGFKSGVVNGFAGAGGDLPPDWERLARILDLVNLVDFLGRDHVSEQMAADVRSLIEATLAFA